MPKPKKSNASTDREVTERLVLFAAELVSQLEQLRSDVREETQRLDETREQASPYSHYSPWSSAGILSCIEYAAQYADWYAMAGLASALQNSVEAYNSQTLENQMEHEAKESQRKYEKREANKQKRLEQEGSLPQQGPTPE